MKKKKKKVKLHRPSRNGFPPFDYAANLKLIKNQHHFENVMRRLALQNGHKVYEKNVKRRRSVVQFYLVKYELIGTSVESFWRPFGGSILIGKA